MPSTAELDQRILAGYRAGATIPELCLAEDVAPQVVRRVLAPPASPRTTAGTPVCPARPSNASPILPGWPPSTRQIHAGNR